MKRNGFMDGLKRKLVVGQIRAGIGSLKLSQSGHPVYHRRALPAYERIIALPEKESSNERQAELNAFAFKN